VTLTVTLTNAYWAVPKVRFNRQFIPIFGTGRQTWVCLDCNFHGVGDSVSFLFLKRMCKDRASPWAVAIVS